jgi:hypothetical protein
MKMNKTRLLAAAAAVLLSATFAIGLTTTQVWVGSGNVSTGNPMPVTCVTGCSGGGSGGDASAANQVITNSEIGATNESAAATDTSTSGLNGLIKRLNQRLTTLITGPLPVSQNGTWTVQPGNTANTTAWKVDGSAVTQPNSVADGQNVTLGAKADAKSTATDTTAVTLMSVTKQISASIQAAAASLAGNLTINSPAVTQSGTWTVQPGNTPNTTAWKVDGSAVTQPVSGTVTATSATAANMKTEPAGNVAAAATDSGNPIKIGAKYNATLPTYTDGQRGDAQIGTRGALHVELWGSDAATAPTVAGSGGDTVSNGNAMLAVRSANMKFNGTSWDRDFTCTTTATISVTGGSTTELVALTASQVIRVCSFSISMAAAGAGTAAFVYGTGTNCGTGQTAITGTVPMAANQNIWQTQANGSLFRTASANALCLTAGTNAVTGYLAYAKY